MEAQLGIIWLLAIGFTLASILGYVAQKLKQSPLIGYLFAGYLIGPNSPGFVANIAIAEQLASIGVTLLMFAVGLSFNWKDLIAVKKIALPGALVLSFLSILAGMFYSHYFGESWIVGLVVGLSICVSSTVVIVRVLSDQGILHTHQGHIVVGWTIVEDLISVFGLLILPALAAQSIASNEHLLQAFYPILWVVFKIIILALFVYFVIEKFVEYLLKIVARTRSHELFTLATLASTFVIAFGSSYFFGVSLALGAFIAGTVIGKTEMNHQAAANSLPMRDAFAVIFFLSVGMLFSPAAVMKNLPLFFGILAILLIFRPIFAFCIVKIANYPVGTALTVAVAIAQIGEYSFILAEEGSDLKILPDNAYDILVASSFITIALNPLLFQLMHVLFKKNLRPQQPLQKTLESGPLQKTLQSDSRAVVVGFGPIGQEVTKCLLKKKYHVLVIDQNIDTVSFLKEQEHHLETIFGDASQMHILEKAHLENASLLVITAPAFEVTQLIIQWAKQLNPSIKIVARSRFQAEAKNLALQNVTFICDEEASLEKFFTTLVNS